jgi:hypothetical protein
MPGFVLDSFALIAYAMNRARTESKSYCTRHRKCDLVTGDPEFKAIEGELKIAWLK